MANDDVFHRFQWQDRNGLTWNVVFYNHSVGFSGFVESSHQRGTGAIHVQTHNTNAQKQSMAFLNDVRVDSHIENRGLGSMLTGEAIEECVRRGHTAMYGYLSDVDADHFPKLKYFYERLGFSVAFNDISHSDYRYDRAGKIEMIFNNVRVEP